MSVLLSWHEKVRTSLFAVFLAFESPKHAYMVSIIPTSAFWRESGHSVLIRCPYTSLSPIILLALFLPQS
jgi:hypothetical protein